MREPEASVWPLIPYPFLGYQHCLTFKNRWVLEVSLTNLPTQPTSETFV